MGDAAQEEASHGDMDHGLGDVEALLEVSDETAPSDHPAEGAFDDPPARQHPEARFAIEAAHDLDDEVEECGFVEQFGAVIGAVGEQMLDPRPAFADRVQDRLGAGAGLSEFLCGRSYGYP